MLNFVMASSLETMETWISLGSVIVIIVICYFFFIRPQSKRDKEVAKMRKDLQVGDNVTTTGGIIGRIVSIKEETVVIETGSDRIKIKMLKSSIASNETIHD